jgi:serine/threonine protein kinase/putative methionine-R-sulfoxide reductase with GAF domain
MSESPPLKTPSGSGRAKSPDPHLTHALDEQSRCWRRGERVAVESLLKTHPTLAGNREAVLDLVYHEIVLREQLGEKPRLDDYSGRFPALADDLAMQFEVDGALESQLFVDPKDRLAPADEASNPSLESASFRASHHGYEILASLGRGGMGKVYKARQISLNRLVALKIMLAGAHASVHELARFRSEAEAVARFQHPNIVQVYEFGVQDGRPFIALELLEASLAKKLAGTPLPARQAAQWIETLAKAIHYAHQHGIVHRDLKPANVLISRDGVLKITDFGMAKIVAGPSGPQSHSGAILGTPSYMAPEQAAGRSRDIGPATDVYGLGALLYELLTGRPPFRASTVPEILEQVRAAEPSAPSRHRSGVPHDLETICLTCLQKDPARRYASAQALADDLGAFLAGKPIQSRRPSPWKRLGHWARRRPAEAVLVATASVAFVGLVVGIFWFHALAVGAAAGLSLLIASAWYSARLSKAVRELTRQQLVAERNVERLRLLLEMARMLMRTQELEELLLVLADTTARLTGAELATIYLVDHERGELWSKVTLDEGVGEIRLPLGKGIAGSVAVSGEPVNIADAYSDPRFERDVDLRTGHKTRNLLTAPITAQDGAILGVFQVINKHEGAFGMEDIEMLSSLAASASIGIEHAVSQGRRK